MRKYDILLCDADDTLLDFALCEKTAVAALLSEFGVKADDALLSSYSEHNDRLWKMLERGEITMQELIFLRFREFFKLHGIKGDGDRAAVRYREILSKYAFTTDGAKELLDRCKGKVRVYVISNGKAEVQISRFKLAGITDNTDGLFISELLGTKKPDTDFFVKAASSISDFSKERALVYGDSLTADIAGGIAFGVDTCWYNPRGKANENGPVPKYEIRTHKELYPILHI